MRMAAGEAGGYRHHMWRWLSAAARRWPKLAAVIDGAVVGAVCGLAVAGAGVPGDRGGDAIPVAYGVVVGVAVIARRRYPRAAVAGTASAVAVASGFGVFVSPAALLGLVVCWFTAAHRFTPRQAVTAALVIVAAQSLATAVAPQRHVAAVVATAVVLWLIADNSRVRRAYVASLEERARQLEQRQADETRRAAARERTRIARELHDVVAHHVGVIAIQAGAARTSAQSGSATTSSAVAALSAIESAARTALTELSHIVGVLRSDTAPELEPQPRLEDLPRLVATVRRSGVDVDLRVEGKARPLPAVVELSAYRVVQEALTNVLKHTAQAAATVVVTYEPQLVTLRVTDTGPALRSPSHTGPGHGILGMTERAAAAGGTMTAGPLPNGGFEVGAVLPAPLDAPPLSEPPPPPPTAGRTGSTAGASRPGKVRSR
jgi:signal transduction histidine kinase